MKVTVNKDGGNKSIWPMSYDMEPKQSIFDVKSELEKRQGILKESQELYGASTYIESESLVMLDDDIVLEDQAQGQNKICLTLCLEERREGKRMMIEIQDLDIPDNIQDSRPILNHLLLNIFEKLPSIAKPSIWQTIRSTEMVKFDTQIQSDKNALRLKVLANKLTNQGKVKTEKWIEIFLHDLRLSVFQHEDQMKSNLKEKGLSQQDIACLLTPLTERDKISLNIEENEKKVLPTGSLQFIPCFSRKLADVDDEVSEKIFDLFQKSLDELIYESADKTRIVMDMARKLKKFNVKELDQLQKEIKDSVMPFLTVLNKYIENKGTFAGLTNCLNSCLKDSSLTNRLGDGADQKLNDLFWYISDIAWKEYEKWVSEFIPSFEKQHLDEFKDFTRKLESGWTPRDILKDNTAKWAILKKDAEEGDQIWMWRERFGGFDYAHVGVFTGTTNMVHVSASGLTAVIKEDPVEAVVGDSKCYLVKSTQKEKIKGSIKERAEACIGIAFAYSVSSGNCESFVNCITNGIFTTDKSSAQGKEYPFIESIIKSVNILRRAMTFKAQDQDLLNKIAERLYKMGFKDEDNIAQIRGFKP